MTESEFTTNPDSDPDSDPETQCYQQESGENWHIYNGDCCRVIQGLPDNSIGFSIFSPPFASLYTYSDHPADMGNATDYDEFFEHFGYLIGELYRVIKPGRLCSIHCMDLPLLKQADGVIGMRDFSGDIIRAMVLQGWIYHSRVTVWKDPVVAMQRSKSIRLLHKQVCKDSSMSGQSIPDYVCTFRKPGQNPEPISGGLSDFQGDPFESAPGSNPSIDIWQRYASPVWMDIRQSNTLNTRMAREENDERHICPLQLDVIARCMQLWSNPGDVVLSPFAGIGSEGVGSIELGRKFVGIELKEIYFRNAARYLRKAEESMKQSTRSLFD
jgi:hypothetical protein